MRKVTPKKFFALRAKINLIFNVADAAITIGVVIVLARAFFMGDKDKAEVDGLMNSKAADAAESK